MLLKRFATFARVNPSNTQRLKEAFDNLRGLLITRGGILVPGNMLSGGPPPTLEDIREEQEGLRKVMRLLAETEVPKKFTLTYDIVTDGTVTENQLVGEDGIVRSMLLVLASTGARINRCPACDKIDFRSKGAGKYCGNKCRVAAHRKRQTSEEREAYNASRRQPTQEQRVEINKNILSKHTKEDQN
ncbi:hypothetical protein [Desulfosediminicola flagellatus]|uniref:hypothetical protein n=1 Tax=Desulfosediminicola flagellatus TaxID=2569541 RepID=UPI0010AD81A6|nr:hypothetical protein [Desulfosediminicola flagellatus]